VKYSLPPALAYLLTEIQIAAILQKRQRGNFLHTNTNYSNNFRCIIPVVL